MLFPWISSVNKSCPQVPSSSTWIHSQSLHIHYICSSTDYRTRQLVSMKFTVSNTLRCFRFFLSCSTTAKWLPRPPSWRQEHVVHAIDENSAGVKETEASFVLQGVNKIAQAFAFPSTNFSQLIGVVETAAAAFLDMNSPTRSSHRMNTTIHRAHEGRWEYLRSRSAKQTSPSASHQSPTHYNYYYSPYYFNYSSCS